MLGGHTTWKDTKSVDLNLDHTQPVTINEKVCLCVVSTDISAVTVLLPKHYIAHVDKAKVSIQRSPDKVLQDEGIVLCNRFHMLSTSGASSSRSG